MPVARLLCEGVSKSLDVRLLSLLLAGPQVVPDGSKFGMDHRIIALQGIKGLSAVRGLRDGDFRHLAPVQRPEPWTRGETHLGWRWARKEVESYLLDPIVVERAFGLHPPRWGRFTDSVYRAVLDEARDNLTLGQAARTALALSSARRSRLNADLDPLPDSLSECKAAIKARVRALGPPGPTQAGVLRRFEELRPEFQPGGWRYGDFLTAYSGKDLAREVGRLDPHFNGLPGTVLRILERHRPAGLTTWLHEWAALATAVAAVP